MGKLKLNDLTTEAHVEISTNLLGSSQEELEPDRSDFDFMQQNEIIDKELEKYDKMLKSWPMVIYKAWTFVYVMTLFLGVVTLISVFISTIDETSTLYFALRILMVLCLLFFSSSIYGCVLLWTALRSKDLLRVEKCIFIFKIFLILGPICFFIDVATMFSEESANEMLFLISCSIPVTAIVNFATGMYVKRVLLERNVFQQVSSYAKK